MNKEEKEAIKTFKNIVIQEYDWWINKGDYAEANVEEANNSIKTILNLIKKQQKEIEELEAKNKQYQGIEKGTTIIYKSKAKYVREDRIEKYYIDKNKIKEFIEKNTKYISFGEQDTYLQGQIDENDELLDKLLELLEEE